MILIADAGSTKTHWCLMTASRHSEDYRTDGLNPFFLNEEQIGHILNEQLLPHVGKWFWAGIITHIFFYGAGCTPQKSPLMKAALQKVFPKASVSVESDMLGAARALFGNQQGIACILGTGSNSARYDGQTFVQQVPALGYILGDEGSGAVLGKRLVSDLLKNQLPAELKELFLTENHLTQADIIERVYRQPLPNRFLASLSPFCAKHIDLPAIRSLVENHFRAFIERNLLQYVDPVCPETPVGFVGSIAYYYRDILSSVLGEYHLTLQSIVQDPMEGLRRYHLNDLTPTC